MVIYEVWLMTLVPDAHGTELACSLRFLGQRLRNGESSHRHLGSKDRCGQVLFLILFLKAAEGVGVHGRQQIWQSSSGTALEEAMCGRSSERSWGPRKETRWNVSVTGQIAA